MLNNAWQCLIMLDNDVWWYLDSIKTTIPQQRQYAAASMCCFDVTLKDHDLPSAAHISVLLVSNKKLVSKTFVLLKSPANQFKFSQLGKIFFDLNNTFYFSFIKIHRILFYQYRCHRGHRGEIEMS